MSIEFCAFDGKGEFDHLLVEPGEGMFISDYANGDREVIGITCGILDDGGEVCLFPPKKAFEDPDTAFVDADDLPAPHATIKVEEDRPHEQEILTEDGDILDIRVRLVSSTEITRSLKIPLGLIYPDKHLAFLQIINDKSDT